MRLLLSLLLISGIVSCKSGNLFSGDMSKSIGLSLEAIGQIPRNIARELVGPDKQNKEQNNRLVKLENNNKELNKRVDDLSNMVNTNKSYLLNLKDNILNNISDIREELKDQDNSKINDYLLDLITDNINNILRIDNQLNILDSNLNNNITNISNDLTNISNDLTNISNNVTDLDNENRIVDIIYPCGYVTGFSEVLFKTNQGQFLAYFEQTINGNGGGLGNTRRYISVLPNGTYQTTDGRNCVFTILNGEVL